MFLPQAASRSTLKFLAYLIAISIVPLFLVGTLSYETAHNALRDSAARNVEQLLTGQQRLLETRLGQVDNLIANISGVEEITNALVDGVPEDSYTRLATQARIGYILNGYLNLDGLLSIDIFGEDGEHYHVGETLDAGLVNQEARREIYVRTLSSGQGVHWVGLVPNVNMASRHKQVVAAARLLTRTDRATLQTRPIGLVLVNYSLDDIAEQLRALDLGAGSLLLLLDQHGRVIYHPDSDEVGKVIHGDLLRLAGAHTPRSVVIADVSYFSTCRKLRQIGWKLCGALPEYMLFAEAVQIRRSTTLIMALSFLIVAGAVWVYHRDVVTPVRAIIGSFKQLQRDRLNPDTRLSVRTKDEIGELTAMFNAFMDGLAARRRSEEALKESEERYALVAKSTNDALWDWDLRTDHIYFSPRFGELLRHQQGALDAVPDTWLARVHPDDLDSLEDALAAHLSNQTDAFHSEHRLHRFDGTWGWFLSRGIAVRDEHGAALRVVGAHTDISARKEAEERLRHDAFYDKLTGTHNRSYLEQHLRNLIARVREGRGEEFAVLFLDLDRFKIVNDTMGHDAGDELLIQVARRIQRELSNGDLVARIGGDEFVALLLLSDADRHLRVGARLVEVMAVAFRIGGQDVTIGTSVGVALSSLDYRLPDDMLRDADIAMYHAKSKGKGCMQVFDRTMRERIVGRMDLEKQFKAVLEGGELELHFQPIVSLADGSLWGFEALARWRHARLGFIPPRQIVEIAEDTGLLLPFAIWTCQEGCRQLAEWRSHLGGQTLPRVGLNLTPRQIADERLLSRIPAILAEYEIPGSALVVEIAETALTREADTMKRVLARLRSHGIGISLDDFGTGYSSLNFVAEFPIDTIKIDLGLLNEPQLTKRKELLLGGLIALARQLEILTVAEGVETDEHLRMLSEHGCAFAQGYFLSRPLEGGEVIALLKSQTKLAASIKRMMAS